MNSKTNKILVILICLVAVNLIFTLDIHYQIFGFFYFDEDTCCPESNNMNKQLYINSTVPDFLTFHKLPDDTYSSGIVKTIIGMDDDGKLIVTPTIVKMNSTNYAIVWINETDIPLKITIPNPSDVRFTLPYIYQGTVMPGDFAMVPLPKYDRVYSVDIFGSGHYLIQDIIYRHGGGPYIISDTENGCFYHPDSDTSRTLNCGSGPLFKQLVVIP